MNEPAVRDLLVCPSCRRGPFTVIPFERDGDEVIHGVLLCGACRAWYRVEHGLPELLSPSLRNAGRTDAFRNAFRSRWDGWDAPGPGSAAVAGDAPKLEQIGFFREHASHYDDGIVDSPFWRAFDRTFLERVGRECGRRGALVEIGAGTGRYTSRLSREFATVLHVDLSEEMVREAMRKAAFREPGPGRVVHFVADAERLPVRDGAADCAVFAGVLSYLASPAAAVGEAARVLAEDGCLVGQENNRSAFRPWFDLLMSLSRSWVAKSFPERGAIARSEPGSWLRGAGLSARDWTEVFLPPHAFNMLSEAGAGRLMRATNAVGSRLPWIARQGGLVLFVGRRARNMES